MLILSTSLASISCSARITAVGYTDGTLSMGRELFAGVAASKAATTVMKLKQKQPNGDLQEILG
jgi:hypothetical protein